MFPAFEYYDAVNTTYKYYVYGYTQLIITASLF